MNEHIAKLKTPGACISFAKNAMKNSRPDLVLEAKRKEVELRAKAYGGKSEAECEAIAAVYDL